MRIYIYIQIILIYIYICVMYVYICIYIYIYRPARTAPSPRLRRSSHLVSPRRAASYRIAPHRVVSCRVASCRIASCHIASSRIAAVLRHAASSHARLQSVLARLPLPCSGDWTYELRRGFAASFIIFAPVPVHPLCDTGCFAKVSARDLNPKQTQHGSGALVRQERVVPRGTDIIC